MAIFIRIITTSLLSGVIGFLLWNLNYYRKEHCFVIPSAGWLPVSDLVLTLLATGLIIGILTVL